MIADDFTVIIQGPGCSTGLDSISTYLTFVKKVVVVVWEEDLKLDVVLKSRNLYKGNKRVLFVIARLPIPIKYIHNSSNIYRQARSTYTGLISSSTKFCIKVRSDERVGNLRPFIEAVASNPNKMTTTNIYFTPDEHCKYQVSDHIVGGSKNLLAKTYSSIIFKCEYAWAERGGFLRYANKSKEDPFKAKDIENELNGKKGLKMWESRWSGVKYAGPEQVLAITFLESLGVPPIAEQSRGQVKDNFYIVNMKKLMPMIWCSNSFGIRSDGEFFSKTPQANCNEEI